MLRKTCSNMGSSCFYDKWAFLPVRLQEGNGCQRYETSPAIQGGCPHASADPLPWYCPPSGIALSVLIGITSIQLQIYPLRPQHHRRGLADTA